MEVKEKSIIEIDGSWKERGAGQNVDGSPVPITTLCTMSDGFEGLPTLQLSPIEF